MWLFCGLISCFLTGGVAFLPAPQNLTVLSTNMKHLLRWNPVVQPRETVFYFVEYQGEYESLYMSHIWIPSSQCSPTQGPECDVTDDITATVPYNFRVRAMLGSQTSAWSTLEHPFNRNSTVLTPPKMEVTEYGLYLVIKLEDLGPQFEFLVVYWRREPGTTKAWKGAALPHEKIAVVCGACSGGEEGGHPSAPRNQGTRGHVLCEGAVTGESHWEAQCLQPDSVCGDARRSSPAGTGSVRLDWLHAGSHGCATLHLEDGPAASILLLPHSGPPRYLENNQFIPEADQLQEGRGGGLCCDCAVLRESSRGLDLRDLRRA